MENIAESAPLLLALTAHVDGIVVGHEVSLVFKFRPWQANQFITDITKAFMVSSKSCFDCSLAASRRLRLIDTFPT
jgi:hypothetical protein